MHQYLRILVFLGLVLYSKSTDIKVGLLISKNDSYNNALKSLSNFAVQNLNTSVTLVTVEYDDKLFSTFEACCQLVTSGVSAIISKGGSSNTAIESDILSPLKIPHLAVSATDPFLWNEDRQYLIRLSSSDNYQSRAIFDLIKHYKWPEVSILASADAYGLNGMVELENLLIADTYVTIKDMLFFSTENCNAEKIHHQLKTIKYSLVKVVVLNAGAKFGRCVLGNASAMGLMGADFVWIVTDAIGAQPESLAEPDGNFLSYNEGLIGIRPAQNKSEKFNAFKDSYILNGGKVDDLTSYTMLTYDTVGLVADALNTLSESILQDIQCSTESKGWDSGETVLNALLKANYSGISGEISFSNDGERRFPSYDILNFVDDKFTSVGRWNSSGLTMTNPVQFLGGITAAPTGVAKNLLGRHLRLGSVEEQPFMYYSTEGCEGNGCWSGMVNDMVIKLAEELGFTYEYIQPKDMKFGARNKSTGEWNGMIRDLLDDKTDMIAIDLSTNSERKSAIDYSFPFMDAGIRAVVKGESGTGNKFFFLSPFDGFVWMMVFVANFILVGLICCLGKLSPFGKYGAKLHAVKTCTCEGCKAQRGEMETKHCSLQETKKFECLIEQVEEDDRSTDASLYNSLWLISTGLVGQTSETLPHCLSGRFLVLTWWAFMLITTSMYTANLTASLTLNNLGISLNQVLELLDQDNYKWGVIGSRHPETLLKTHQDSRYSRLVDEGVALANLTHALDTLRDGSFVFIDEGPVLAHNLISDCDVFSVGEEFQSFEYAFGLPKDSPYKSLIDSYLLKFREEGFIDILWKKWSSGNSVCSQSGIGKKVTLDLNTLAGVFYLLLSGVGISFLLFSVEFVYVTAKDSRLLKNLTFFKAFKRRVRFILEDVSNKKEENVNYENTNGQGQTVENYCTDVDI